MKKLICMLLALSLMTLGFAMAETIAPMVPETLNTTDAEYPAAFNRDDLKDGTLGNVKLFSEDIYDIVDVSKMAVGDTFVAEGREIEIKTLETDEAGNLNINGGMDGEDGYTLTPEDESNCWTTLISDDFCTYTQRAEMSLPLAEDVTLSDSWDIDGEEVTATGIQAVTDAIMASENDSFYEHNTTIRIVDGKIAQITRHYVP